jgi:hypothetical protein
MATMIITIAALVVIPAASLFAGADSRRPNVRNWA